MKDKVTITQPDDSREIRVGDVWGHIGGNKRAIVETPFGFFAISNSGEPSHCGDTPGKALAECAPLKYYFLVSRADDSEPEQDLSVVDPQVGEWFQHEDGKPAVLTKYNDLYCLRGCDGHPIFGERANPVNAFWSSRDKFTRLPKGSEINIVVGGGE